MTDDIKDEFIEEALRLGGFTNPTPTMVQTVRCPTYASEQHALAHARTLQDHAAKMQEVSDAVDRFSRTSANNPKAILDSFNEHLAPLVLPQPDPDEELAREVADRYAGLASGWAGEQGPYATVALATIKALRDKGMLK